MRIEASVEIFAGYNLRPIKEKVIEKLALNALAKSPHLSTAEDIIASESRGEPITDRALNNFLSDIGELEIIFAPAPVQSSEETLLVLVIRTTLPQDTGLTVLSYKPLSLLEDPKACKMTGYQSINRENTEVYAPQGGTFIAVSRNISSDAFIYSIPCYEN